MLSTRRWLRHRDDYSKWLSLAVLVNLAGAAVQMSRVRLHAYFNHNDLFHVIQLVAMVLFYRGATLARDLPLRARS